MEAAVLVYRHSDDRACGLEALNDAEGRVHVLDLTVLMPNEHPGVAVK